MRRAIVVVGAVFAIACGGGSKSPSTPSPSPIQPAQLVMDGQPQLVTCARLQDTCTFQGALRNVGTGCATSVGVTVKFYNAQDQQVGATLAALPLLPQSAIMRPNEVITYQALNVPGSVWRPSSKHLAEPTWTDVRCQ